MECAQHIAVDHEQALWAARQEPEGPGGPEGFVLFEVAGFQPEPPAVPDGAADSLTEVADRDPDPLDPGAFEAVEHMEQQGTPPDGQQGFRAVVGVGSESRAESSGHDEGFADRRRGGRRPGQRPPPDAERERRFLDRAQAAADRFVELDFARQPQAQVLFRERTDHPASSVDRGEPGEMAAEDPGGGFGEGRLDREDVRQAVGGACHQR